MRNVTPFRLRYKTREYPYQSTDPPPAAGLPTRNLPNKEE